MWNLVQVTSAAAAQDVWQAALCKKRFFVLPARGLLETLRARIRRIVVIWGISNACFQDVQGASRWMNSTNVAQTSKRHLQDSDLTGCCIQRKLPTFV